MGGTSKRKPATGGSQRRHIAGLEAACVLLAPVVVFLALHVRAMPRDRVLDTYFYGGYAIDGPDMIQRLGSGNYFWPRVGFILPDHLAVSLAGPLAGFFTFRYVLALVATGPLYLLVRRALGRWQAWLAVTAVLTCPVVLAAWGTDYPDSSALSYLVAAASCLLMPARTTRARTVWAGGGGLFLALAVTSQAVAALMGAAVLAGWLWSAHGDGVRRLWRELGAAAAAAIATTAVLMAAAQVVLGHWDIVTPTVAAIVHYRPAGGAMQFHSRTWRWLIDDTYLFAPPALVLAWLALVWPGRGRVRSTRPEVAVAVATAAGFALHALAEWGADNWTLEYYLYSSLLWATTCPLLAFVLLRAAGARTPRPSRLALAVATAALLAVPLLLRPFRDQLQIGFAVALALVPATALAAVVARRALRHVALRAVATGALAVTATLLLVGTPTTPVVYPGQVSYYISPDYGSETFGDATAELDRYTVFSELHTLVPAAGAVPGALLTWAPPRHSFLVDAASAQYLWILDALPSSMPNLTSAGLQELRDRRAHLVVLLSDTGAEIAGAEAALAAAGLQPRTLRVATLRAGADALHVRVVELDAA